jgi:dolichyl-phosphate-mannose-protein mannosyltransferase
MLNDSIEHNDVADGANDPSVTKDRSHLGLRSRWVYIAVVTLVVLGCALRTAQYMGRVSLWHDELAIVRNLEQKDIRHLLTEPLANKQVAPIGFVAAVAVSSRLFGINEFGVRLVPWLFALASVLLFWRVAERFASGAALIAGMTLFAVSPALIFYGASVKPYVLDVAVILLLVFFAIRHRERPDDLRIAWIAGVVGCVAFLFSYPAVLVSALVIPILLIAWARTQPRQPLAPLATMIGCWSTGMAIAVAVALMLRDPETVAYMKTFWGSRGGFPPSVKEGLGAMIAWGPRQILSVFAHFLLFITPSALVGIVAGPLAALAVVGLPWLWRRSRFYVALLLAPIAGGLMGAFVGLLPFRHRTGVYAGSAVLVLSMVGLEALRTWLPARVRWLMAVVATLVAGPLALIVLLAARPPYPTQEARPVLQELTRRRDANDVVYVYCAGRHAIEFYGPRVGLSGWIQGGCHDDILGFLRELDQFRGQPRLWFFFTQSHGQETVIMRSYLRTIGHERAAIPDPSGDSGETETAGYLFDLSDTDLLGRVTAESFVLSGGELRK